MSNNNAKKYQWLRQWLHFAACGMLIGIADLFPGVSGGTMALLTGVYARFIHALAQLRPALLLLLRGRIRQSLGTLDWLFLTALVAGMGVSIITFARLVKWLLVHYQTQLLLLFAGLVCYTAFSLIRKIDGKAHTLILGIMGFFCAFFLAELAVFFGAAGTAAIPLPFFALGGALAIAAMLLPGISGSLLLLLIGMYEPVIHAITELEITILATFALGAIVGLLSFASLLRYSYEHFQQHTLAFLAGLTFGAVRGTLLEITSTVILIKSLPFAVIGIGLGKVIDHVAGFNHAKNHVHPY